MLNLVVAVILEIFSHQDDETPHLIGRSDIEYFAEVWLRFDPDATNEMPTEKLADLLLLLPPPLGLKGAPRRRAVPLCLHLLVNEGLASEGDQISFSSVLKGLLRHNYSSHAVDVGELAGDVVDVETLRKQNATEYEIVKSFAVQLIATVHREQAAGGAISGLLASFKANTPASLRKTSDDAAAVEQQQFMKPAQPPAPVAGSNSSGSGASSRRSSPAAARSSKSAVNGGDRTDAKAAKPGAAVAARSSKTVNGGDRSGAKTAPKASKSPVKGLVKRPSIPDDLKPPPRQSSNDGQPSNDAWVAYSA